MKISAGILFYQTNPLQVLLVHPSGDYNRNSPWSIPKGEANSEEEKENLWKLARRETNEELGILVGEKWPNVNLGVVVYKNNRKAVFAFGVDYRLVSNQEIQLNWENDRAEWFSLEEAQKIIHPNQVPFILTLLVKLHS